MQRGPSSRPPRSSCTEAPILGLARVGREREAAGAIPSSDQATDACAIPRADFTYEQSVNPGQMASKGPWRFGLSFFVLVSFSPLPTTDYSYRQAWFLKNLERPLESFTMHANFAIQPRSYLDPN